MKSIRWRVALPYIVLIFSISLWITLYTSAQIRDTYTQQLETHLFVEARQIAENAENLMSPEPNQPALGELVRQQAIILGERITVFDADGNVVAESHKDLTEIGNEFHRAEIQGALATGRGSTIRFSRTYSYDFMYTAVPIRVQSKTVGFARIAVSMQKFDEQYRTYQQNIFIAVSLALITAILLSIWITQSIITPIKNLTGIAERVAKGDLNTHIIITGQDELAQLGRTFNAMAEQLRDKVESLAEERAQITAVLNTMADGVIITDEKGQVLLINPSAARILKTPEDKALNRTFAQLVYHHQLIALWRHCYETGEEQTQAVETHDQSIFVQAVITPLTEGNKQRLLVILQDLTRIRRLETIRRDFISNISHELRTPLASLKVVVETLRDGAIEDPINAQRFLGHIETEVNLLTQMVQELLELSRIESNKAPLNLQATPIEEIITLPVERLSPQAERAKLIINTDIAPNLPEVYADSERMSQVITNLIHNAIKFTPPGGTITIAAERHAKDEIVITIKDTGTGISEQDLPRIFERFYKADQSRTRRGGGTGLGLAIAKHIVQGHGGRIWAESRKGEGSTFYLTLKTSKLDNNSVT